MRDGFEERFDGSRCLEWPSVENVRRMNGEFLGVPVAPPMPLEPAPLPARPSVRHTVDESCSNVGAATVEGDSSSGEVGDAPSLVAALLLLAEEEDLNFIRLLLAAGGVID